MSLLDEHMLKPGGSDLHPRGLSVRLPENILAQMIVRPEAGEQFHVLVVHRRVFLYRLWIVRHLMLFLQFGVLV